MNRWLHARQLVLAKRLSLSDTGYTITEVLIVLVVSAMMFVAIALSFRGRHGEVAFTQAVRNFETKIENMASDVANGYYPSEGYECNKSGVGGRPVATAVAASEPGDSKDCVFMGKLWVAGKEKSVVYTVLGLRKNDSDNLATSFSEAKLQAIDITQVIEKYTHSYGLEIRRVYVLPATPPLINVAKFGFFHMVSGGAASGETSSGRTILLYGLPATSVVSTPLLTPAEQELGDTLVKLNSGVIICLLGGNDRRAQIRIGENASQASIISEINITDGPCASA